MPHHDPENTIAFQGVAGAHSDMACKIAHPYLHTLPCHTFEDAFDAVIQGKAKYAMIPIENSHAGRVAEIHNLLPNTPLHVIGEYFHRVSHHLMAPKGTKLEQVKQVYSHNQALMQCRATLRTLGMEPVPYPDTAAAAKFVAETADSSKAALASNIAAELYGLEILKENMQDSNNNRTLFLTFAREPLDIAPQKDDFLITSLVFTTRDIAACLYKALGGFATNGINILKLESYIPDYSSGVAQFFATVEGNPADKYMQNAMEELGFFSKHIKLLGVYPADARRFEKL